VGGPGPDQNLGNRLAGFLARRNQISGIALDSRDKPPPVLRPARSPCLVEREFGRANRSEHSGGQSRQAARVTDVRPGCAGPGVVGSGLPIRIDDGNVGVSQVPWKPWWSLSVFFDPGRIRQAEWTMSELPDTAPAYVQNEGSTRLQLSGLNHTTFDLAVYASQGGSHHRLARLASGCWSGFARRDSYPQSFMPLRGTRYDENGVELW